MGATVAFTTTGPRASLRDVRSRRELRQRCQAAPDMTATMACLRRGVGVGDDQPHPAKPAGLERTQERRPKGAVLAVAHIRAEDLAATVSRDPAGDHHRAADHPAVDPGLEVGRVHEQEGGAGQRAERNAATSASSSPQIRPASDLEPASTPKAVSPTSGLVITLNRHRPRPTLDP